MGNFDYSAAEVVDMMEMCNLLIDNGYRMLKLKDGPTGEAHLGANEADELVRRVDEQNRRWREIMSDGEDSVMAKELELARRRAELAQIEAEVDNPELVGALKSWRHDKAKELNVPVYLVLNNKTLLLIACRAPATMEELLAVHGFGPAKAEKFGAEILDIVATCSELMNLVD